MSTHQTIYALSEADLIAIRRTQSLASKLANLHDGGKVDHEEQPSPEFHIIYTPSGGIPAKKDSDTPGTGTLELQDDVPGSAECEVWRILDDVVGVLPTVSPADGLSYLVYNIFGKDIPGLSLCLAARDKFGTWVVIHVLSTPEADVGTGTTGEGQAGPSPCTLACITATDCVMASGPENRVILSPTGTPPTATWNTTGGNTLTYFDNTTKGAVSFWFTSGSLHLSVGGLELLDCGDGCFTGGPLTGHIRDVGTAPPYPEPACNGEVFTVCVSCTCCSVPLWSGPGWYCVREPLGTGVGTGYFFCVVAELLELDRCDNTIEICSGPYPTELDAEVNCQPDVDPGTGTGTHIPGTGTGTIVPQPTSGTGIIPGP